jgi:hypothetical protein
MCLHSRFTRYPFQIVSFPQLHQTCTDHQSMYVLSLLLVLYTCSFRASAFYLAASSSSSTHKSCITNLLSTAHQQRAHTHARTHTQAHTYTCALTHDRKVALRALLNRDVQTCQSLGKYKPFHMHACLTLGLQASRIPLSWRILIPMTTQIEMREEALRVQMDACAVKEKDLSLHIQVSHTICKDSG